MFPLTFALVCLCSQRLYAPPDFCIRLFMLTEVVRPPLNFALDPHNISFVLTFGLTHRCCTFPLAFVNTSQDWLILQISLASLRVAHMASHWRMAVVATKFNTPSQRGSHSQPHQACLLAAQTVSRSEAWSGYQLPARSWLCIVTL
jgi:hypothetical protein